MSILFDKEFLKFTGMDMIMIQNAPQASTSQGPQPHEFEEFLRQLTKSLKEMVFQAVAELKQECLAQTEAQTTNEVIDAMPISFRVPDENDQQKQRSKAKLVGEIKRSFKLPEEYFAGHDVDLNKLPVPAQLLEQMKPDAEYERRFSFSERLSSWKLLRKQRVNGKFDTYFQHDISDEFFRSVVEVTNFMLYAICPRHLQKIAKVTPKENSSGSKSRKRARSASTSFDGGNILKEETHSAPVTVREHDAKAVRDFLEEAYNDLLNLHSRANDKSEEDTILVSSDSEESEKPEEETGLVSESKKNGEPKENAGMLSASENREKSKRMQEYSCLTLEEDAGLLSSAAPEEDIVLLSDSGDNNKQAEDTGVILPDASEAVVEDSMAREFDDILAGFVEKVMTAPENKRKRAEESKEEEKITSPSPFFTSETSLVAESSIPEEEGKAKAPIADTIPAGDAQVHNNMLQVPEPVPAGEEEGASAAATLGSFADIFDPLDRIETLPEPYYNPNDYDLAKCLVKLRNNGEDDL